MGSRHIPEETQATIARAILDEYRLVEDVAKEYGVSGSTAARYAAIEREGRKRAAAARREVTPGAAVNVSNLVAERDELQAKVTKLVQGLDQIWSILEKLQ